MKHSMDDFGKDSAEAIEKVLAGLRDIEAPTGMERRILAGLDGRAAERSASWRWQRVVRRGVPVSYVACGAVLAVFVLALAVPVMRRFGHTPAQPKIAAVPAGSTPASRSVVAATDAASAPREPKLRLASAPDASQEAMVRVNGPVGDFAADPEDSVAMSEMRAASFPAPPMPLTEQERLFLRITRSGETVELAVLDPHLRELEDREEKAEFQRFFARASAEQILARQAAMEQAARNPEAADQAAAAQSAKEQITKESSTPATEQSTPEKPTTEQLTPGQSTTEKPTPERPTTDESTPR